MNSESLSGGAEPAPHIKRRSRDEARVKLLNRAKVQSAKSKDLLHMAAKPGQKVGGFSKVRDLPHIRRQSRKTDTRSTRNNTKWDQRL